MKHMLNLLVLLSLSFAAQAGPGGPAIDDEGESAADTKGLAADKKAMESVINMIATAPDDATLQRVIKVVEYNVRMAEKREKNPEIMMEPDREWMRLNAEQMKLYLNPKSLIEEVILKDIANYNPPKAEAVQRWKDIAKAARDRVGKPPVVPHRKPAAPKATAKQRALLERVKELERRNAR